LSTTLIDLINIIHKSTRQP